MLSINRSAALALCGRRYVRSFAQSCHINILSKSVYKTAPDITHLLEIYVTDERLLDSEHNKPSAVVDEPLSFTTDEFDPASEGDSGPREATPQAYRAVKQPHLRIDMQYLAKNHSCGVVFGTGVDCDVSLDRDDKTGIEDRHFAVQMKQEPESFEIKVLSKRRTLIQLDSDGYVGVRRRRAFQGQSLDGKEKSAGIQIHSLGINLVAVNHSHHYGDFIKAWSKHYDDFSNQVAPLRGLALSAGPSSTQRSLEYHPLDGYSGAGSGRCRLYRVLNKSTHFT
ncbi:hypothetical protein J3459_011889 [Metarhizium acridum]|uniref:uncharacterized protein n=1 Tax=Metarhizium acridum TaxID=92637 RepID=UPI001C6BDED8|nr:hypothetical protein J3458_022077 [Metarhizium acridum]KAG8418908.1 hypothetical protein J3459_011889 [Metarhizium acridum]